MIKNKALSGHSPNNHLDFLSKSKQEHVFFGLVVLRVFLVANISGGD
jgi:hypothetical protein